MREPSSDEGCCLCIYSLSTLPSDRTRDASTPGAKCGVRMPNAGNWRSNVIFCKEQTTFFSALIGVGTVGRDKGSNALHLVTIPPIRARVPDVPARSPLLLCLGVSPYSRLQSTRPGTAPLYPASKQKAHTWIYYRRREKNPSRKT